MNITELAESFVACTPKFGAGKTIIQQCGLCELFATVQNVIDFMFRLAIPLGVVAIVIGGMAIMTAADSENRLKWGRETLKSAIIGIVLVFSSWIILNTVMSVLVSGKDFEKFANGWRDLGEVCKAGQSGVSGGGSREAPGGGESQLPGGGTREIPGGGGRDSPGGGESTPAGGGSRE